MEQKIKELEINGTTYVPKGSTQPVILGEYVIVRSKDAGVFFCIVDEREGDYVKVTDSRRIWYWEGAASLSQLAVKGTSSPNGCKFPCSVPSMEILGVVEIIPCTEEAIKSIKEVPIWEV